MPEARHLDDKVVIVTGASSGIGEAIAETIAAAGGNLFCLSRRPSSVGTHIPCDLADSEAVLAAVTQVVSRGGGLDILINAAGQSLAPDAGFDSELRRFRHTLDVNLTGAYACILAGRDALIASKGSVVNVTSINARQGFPDNPGYVAAKSGLAGLTRALAVDLGPHGVRVNAVAPGYVRTAMTEASFADGRRRADREKHTALGRWGTPEEIAQAVLFLASPLAGYITGHELVADGGWTIKGLVDLAGAQA